MLYRRQKYLDPIRGPNRHADAEQISILRSYRAATCERAREQRPIVRIAVSNMCSRRCFLTGVVGKRRFQDQFANPFISGHGKLCGQAALGKDRRQMLFCLLEGNVWCREFHLLDVAVEQASQLLAQHRTYQNIRIDYHTFTGHVFGLSSSRP